MEWIEIPAQRLLHVSLVELATFERRGGQLDEEALWVRPDGRVFRRASLQPFPPPGGVGTIYLQEV